MTAPYVGLSATVTIASTAISNATVTGIPFGQTKTESYMLLGQATKTISKVPVSIDPGKVTVSFLYDKTIVAALFAVRGVTTTYSIVTSDTAVATYTGSCTVMDCTTEFNPDKIVMSKVELEMTGAITVA